LCMNTLSDSLGQADLQTLELRDAIKARSVAISNYIQKRDNIHAVLNERNAYTMNMMIYELIE